MILKAFAIQREKRKVEASIRLEEVQSARSQIQSVVEEARPVFVLEDEEESTVAIQDEKRQTLSSSPVAM